jgi:hypothetical protein
VRKLCTVHETGVTPTWLAGAKARLRPDSVAQAHSRLKRVLPVIGALAITSITRATVRDVVATIQAQGSRRVQGKGVSPRTIRATLSTLSGILSQAVEDGLIPSNHCARPGRLRGGLQHPR